MFNTVQKVAENRRLLQVNKALLRIVALLRFMQQGANRSKANASARSRVILENIQKAQEALGLKLTLKSLRLTHQAYWRLWQKTNCKRSVFRLCVAKHPSQLLPTEVAAIKKYCADLRFIHWPLASVYHQLIRDKAAGFHISTFYKYVGRLQLKRTSPKHRRKDHRTGIRAAALLQLLHTDVTVFKTADNTKAYIYLVQDNFSRAILQFTVSLQCKAHVLVGLLKRIHTETLQTRNVGYCQLMSDDGGENFGAVQRFLQDAQNPDWNHIVAQRDVDFSNSMIEAAHKSLKYGFLYHKQIPDYNSLCLLLPKAVDDYNNRPHAALHGQTPSEVLKGEPFDKSLIHRQFETAKATRIAVNRQQNCCAGGF